MGCINWAWKIQGLRTNEKLLLVALADDADSHTGECHRSTTSAKLAEDCSLSVRSVQRLLIRLDNFDLIHFSEKNPGRGDNLRIIHVHSHSVDPIEWRPPAELGRRAIMSTSAFLELARQAFIKQQAAAELTDHELMYAVKQFDAAVANMRVMKVSGDRFWCFVPKVELAETIEKNYGKLILAIAQKYINKRLAKFRLWYPKTKKGQITPEVD